MPSHPHQAIIDGLCARQAWIAPKYFYDQRGSELFEAITALSEYYPTRTETALMAHHGDAIAACVGRGVALVELGAGNCTKARALCRSVRPACYVGVDISGAHLQAAVVGLRSEFPNLDVHAVVADMGQVVSLPNAVPRARRLVFYPGSSIGNFDPQQALALLERMRAMVDDDGAVLIGIDLPKALSILEPAYDDAGGVTAAFNRNVLDHVNRLIGSNFDSARWQHRAFFNAAESRIEMHLETPTAVQVAWPGGARRFVAGERIHTENSYKYPLATFTRMLGQAGFSHTQAWTDAQGWFAVVYARP
jgi:L-histidine N-alpha-methyltransferase